MEAKQNVNDILDRWHKRFQRAIAIYTESFIDEQFDDIVAVLVTGAFLEALLWLGIQFAGFRPETPKKTLPLSRLIDTAKAQGLLDEQCEALLRSFNDIRNDVAHDIDYKMERKVVDELFHQLPDKSKHDLYRAFANILPEPSTGVVARLTFEQIVVVVFGVMDSAVARWRGEQA